jgi:hypothetical protein
VYDLKTVGDLTLPLVGFYTTTAGQIDLLGETMTPNADGSFIWTRTYRRTVNGVPETYSIDSRGPYTYVGGVATFHQNSGGSGDYVLSAAGDLLTTTYPGAVWVYRRR